MSNERKTAKYQAGETVLVEAYIEAVHNDRKHHPHIYTLQTDAELGYHCRYTECSEEAIVAKKDELYGVLVIAAADWSTSRPSITTIQTLGDADWTTEAVCSDAFIELLREMVDGDFSRSDVTWIELGRYVKEFEAQLIAGNGRIRYTGYLGEREIPMEQY